MFLPSNKVFIPGPSFPRVRGDVPPRGITQSITQSFSPRARGCSPMGTTITQFFAVFPACAGMFRRYRYDGTRSHSFPRVRGDVPSPYTMQTQLKTFSPRARGCSVFGDGGIAHVAVFPACAGMFLPGRRRVSTRICFPRVRGDVPVTKTQEYFEANVFPACAGMFPMGGSSEVIKSGFPRVRGDVPDATCFGAATY